MDAARYNEHAEALIDQRLSGLRGLSFDEIGSLPEYEGSDIAIEGKRCCWSRWRLTNPPSLPGAILVTVRVCRKLPLAIYSHVIERGLVFTPGGGVREATDQEIIDSGG